MLRAVIFDMDGLLIDSEPLWVRAEREVFARFGVHLLEEDCVRTKGLRVDDVVAYWDETLGFRNGTRRDVEAALIARVVDLVTTEGRAMPGVETALAAARAEGGRHLAVASSSPTPILKAALTRLGLADTFDAIHSAEHLAHGKPHPNIFLHTASTLGVTPSECVVLEDSMTGVIAAKAARMGCIAVPFDHPTHDARFVLADAIVASLTDVTSTLLERACTQRSA